VDQCFSSDPPNGFGFAVRRILADFRGDAVAIFIADGSDPPADLVASYCGLRLRQARRAVGYPPLKLAFNRLETGLCRS
jgi:dolichol-phosphate mannosyltransferase